MQCSYVVVQPLLEIASRNPSSYFLFMVSVQFNVHEHTHVLMHKQVVTHTHKLAPP